jgi:hypothetical protein
MNARVIPTRVHGMIDYATGSALLAAPELFRMESGTVAALAPRAVGAGTTAYSAATDYELGARRVVPMPVHLAADAASGVALAAAPWVAGDAKRGLRYWVPHAVVGGTEVVLAATTRTHPADERLRNRVRRLALRGMMAAPGSRRTKGRLIGGVMAVRSPRGRKALMVKARRSAQRTTKPVTKAARRNGRTGVSAATRMAVLGLGLARELARQT